VNIATTSSVVIVGQGYVGLPLVILMASCGHRVTGVDTDQRRVSLIAEGQSPVGDVTDSQLQAALDSKLYRAVSGYESLGSFDFAIITVPTPLRQGSPDLSFIESAGKSLAKYVSKGSTVVLESTTYPGTTEELLVPILEEGSGLRAGIDFYVGYSPERIDPGNPEWNLTNTPKIVSGVNPLSSARVEEIYKSAGIPTVRLSGTREAELSKLLENTFRHVNIALVNELAMFSRALGVNIWESIEAAGTKPFGFMKFSPGPGVGGHCLPVDPSYLSWAVEDRTGSSFQFVDLANKVNSQMPTYVVARATEILAQSGLRISGSKIAILGLSYKANSSDTRESPSLEVTRLLINSGAKVSAIDPFVPEYLWPAEIRRAEKETDEVFDLAIHLTNHSGDAYDWVLEKSSEVLDTRNSLPAERFHSL
jgi:UDP-N-acetyl-D-glucosamine dehydrogenase